MDLGSGDSRMLMLMEEKENQEPLPDITNDSYGHLSNSPDSYEIFDAPPQRMSDTLEHESMEDQRGRLPVRLCKEAFARVIENFERKLTTEFHYLPEDRKITLNEALFAQAKMFRKVVEGNIQVYQPLLLR